MRINGVRVKENACACSRCRGACERRPCFPTPAEATRLREKYPDRFVRDNSVSIGPRNIVVWRPKGSNEESDGLYRGHKARCTFLTTDGRCELHDDGKPLEGRLASHHLTDRESALLRAAVAQMWL